jgi:hypothetical protein
VPVRGGGRHRPQGLARLRPQRNLPQEEGQQAGDDEQRDAVGEHAGDGVGERRRHVRSLVGGEVGDLLRRHAPGRGAPEQVGEPGGEQGAEQRDADRAAHRPEERDGRGGGVETVSASR